MKSLLGIVVHLIYDFIKHYRTILDKNFKFFRKN